MSSSSTNNVRRPRRAVRPCDICRLRKSRCVIPTGSSCCTLCRTRQTPCTFERKPPSRLSQTRGSRSPGGNDQSQGYNSLPASHVAYRALAPNTGITPEQISSAPEPAEYSALVSGPSGLLGNAQELLEGTRAPDPASCEPPDTSLGLCRSRFAELYGLTSDMEPILMRHRPYDPETNEFRLETHSIRRVLQQDMGMQYPVTFHVSSDKKALGYHAEAVQHDTIERCVQPYGPSLVKLFWKIVHPYYPILYKQGFMERYLRSYRNVPAPLLGAVYLISLNWWSYDPELSNKTAPDASFLREAVINAIQNSYHRPKLSSIEATLLLLQCKPEDALNPDHTWTWGCTGQALSVGEAIGLHLDASSWDIPDWEKGLRKRLSWALYVQDKWTALMHGRPSHIHDDNWGVRDLTDDDFFDLQVEDQPGFSPLEGDPEVGKQEFMALVSLTKILSDILSLLYTVRASQIQDTVQLYEIALPILERLSHWHQHLSPSLLMSQRAVRQLSANGFIHLSYHTLVLTVLRRIIRSTALAPLCFDVAVLNRTRTLSSDAAEAATAFVRALRPDHLEAFWTFSSGFGFSLIGSFITLLLVTSRSETEKTHWREALNDYLWTLRLMGKASEPMSYAVNRLEGAILRGMEHALAVKIAPTVIEPDDRSRRHDVPSNAVPPTGPQSPTMDSSLPLHPATSEGTGDWVTLFMNEDLVNLDLSQFDWLGGGRSDLVP